MSAETRKRKTRKRPTASDEKETLMLEEVVFGGSSKFAAHLDDDDLTKSSQLRSIKTHNVKRAEPDVRIEVERRRPAWIDQDDYESESGDGGFAKTGNRFNVNSAANCRWAQRNRLPHSDEEADEEDEADAYVRSTGKYLTSAPSSLPPNELAIERLRDFPTAGFNGCARNVEFHKRSQVFMAAGFGSRICFYQVDGKENPLLHSIAFERCIVRRAHFTADGQKVIVVPSKHHCLYYYDMPEDKIVSAFWPRGFGLPQGEFSVSPDGSLFVFHCSEGRLVLLSSKSCDLVGVLKVDGDIVGTAFSANGELLYSYCSSGKVYVWNVAAQRCAKTFVDRGCITGSSLALSPDDSYIACGCSTGVVNLYKVDSVLSDGANRSPLKTVMNLTTAAERMVFNGATDILAMVSSQKENAMKLLHVRSGTVFSNYPIEQYNLGFARDVDFSPNGGYMCVGNSKGKLKLFKLMYYGGY
uniref:Anaphase-promoting complex subunit 4 WD40 domain-containing protein n=1 Tax=Trichuris muris TaxID=70415 RepID=A0A5S6QSW9_TRIMR